MSDLISRKAAIEAMRCINDSICEQQAVDAICDLPTAEVTLCHLESPCEYQNADIAMPSAQPERKVGKWVEQPTDGRFGKQVECSECGEVYWAWMANFGYCPNCGADMRGE